MNERNRLHWRCRRGTLELDMMLIRYLDTRYAAAEPLEQQAFIRLLGLEDDELSRYLLGAEPPERLEFLGVVAAIRTTPASVHQN